MRDSLARVKAVCIGMLRVVLDKADAGGLYLCWGLSWDALLSTSGERVVERPGEGRGSSSNLLARVAAGHAVRLRSELELLLEPGVLRRSVACATDTTRERVGQESNTARAVQRGEVAGVVCS